MIGKKGICSVTFRKLSPNRIIQLAKTCHLDCIEWGGDKHVPDNDLNNAKYLRKFTEESGLSIFSYGSYFRMDSIEKFKSISETAKVLNAKIIRVWAGTKDAEEFTAQEFTELVRVAKECANIAGANGQIIAFEFHHHTYNNCHQNSKRLLSAINMDNVKTYWQPTYWKKFESNHKRIQYNLDTISALKNDIICVHIYHRKSRIKLPLFFGMREWKKYNELLPKCYGFLEFTTANSINCFFCDALCFRLF